MAAASLAPHVGVAPACRALGVSRATFYRRQRRAPGRQQPHRTPARALDGAEREHILEVLASPRFVDRAPAEVVATLLDEGHYLCSERTMVRLLAAEQPVRERRHQRTRPPYCPSPNSSPPGRTRPGRGTSPACSDRSAGRTSTCTCCSTSSAAMSWGGWSPNARTPLLPRHAHRADLPEARHRAPGAHPALRPRRPRDPPVHRAAPRRPRRHPLTEPPPGQRRQPLLRSAVQDPEVPPRLPRTLRGHRRRDHVEAARSSPGTTPSTATAASRCSPPMTSITAAPSAFSSNANAPERAAWSQHPERFVRGTPKPQALPREVWINPPTAATTPHNAH